MKTSILILKMLQGVNLDTVYTEDNQSLVLHSCMAGKKVQLTLMTDPVSISRAICLSHIGITATCFVDNIQAFRGELSKAEIQEVHEALNKWHKSISNVKNKQMQDAYDFVSNIKNAISSPGEITSTPGESQPSIKVMKENRY